MLAAKKNTYRLKSSVFLVGMMGSGKSKVGKLLAEAIGVDFIDTDEVIIAMEGKSITDIFTDPALGQDYFRKKELSVMKKILSTTANKKNNNKIIAGGGGSFINPAIRKLLREQQVVTIYIDAPVWALWMRVRHGKDRPLLKDKNPRKKLREIYNARRATYMTADIILPFGPLGGGSKKKNMSRLLSILIKHGIAEAVKGE
ncbi:MAG: shikimate kinase [Hydrotalea sp.]|nr:shikimate kinase [Hydrotalea sp.]